MAHFKEMSHIVIANWGIKMVSWETVNQELDSKEPQSPELQTAESQTQAPQTPASEEPPPPVEQSSHQPQTPPPAPSAQEFTSPPATPTPPAVNQVEPPVPTIPDFRLIVKEARRKRREAKLQKILAFAAEKGSVTNREIRKLLRVSDATATRYAQELVRRGVLVRYGRLRYTIYKPI